jgi:hypothetical protein
LTLRGFAASAVKKTTTANRTAIFFAKGYDWNSACRQRSLRSWPSHDLEGFAAKAEAGLVYSEVTIKGEQ